MTDIYSLCGEARLSRQNVILPGEAYRAFRRDIIASFPLANLDGLAKYPPPKYDLIMDLPIIPQPDGDYMAWVMCPVCHEREPLEDGRCVRCKARAWEREIEMAAAQPPLFTDNPPAPREVQAGLFVGKEK